MRKMFKVLVITFSAMFIVGCGKLDRYVSSITGNASEVCMKGVLYYQFTSGASVAYDVNGKVIPCR